MGAGTLRVMMRLVQMARSLRGATPLEIAGRLRLAALRPMSARWQPVVPLGITTQPVFRALGDQDALVEALRRAGLADEAIREGERVLAGDFILFDRFPLHAPSGIPDWLEGLPSGERWKAEPSFGIDLSCRDSRDPRFTWELSRHGEAVALARAAFVSADARFSDRAATLVSDWIAANPFLIGPNWSSAKEVAMRAISWAFVDDAVGTTAAFAEEAFRRRFVEALYLHGLYLARFTSLGLTSCDDMTAEAAGLCVLGTKFSRAPGGSGWRARGRSCLEREIARRTVPRSAPHRHGTSRFTTGLLGMCLALERERPFSAGFKRHLREMYVMLDTRARADGSFAGMGDGDQAPPPRLAEARRDNLSGDLALAAALFPDADFRVRPVSSETARNGLHERTLFTDALAPAARPAPEPLWLLGARGQAAPALHATPRHSVVFPAEGLAVFKSPSGALQVELACGCHDGAAAWVHVPDCSSVTKAGKTGTGSNFRDVSETSCPESSAVAPYGERRRMSPAFPSTAGPRPPDALTLTAWHAGVQKSRGASRPAVCRASLTIDASSHDEPAPARTAILGSFLSDEVDWACGTLAAGPPHHWSHKRDVVRVESDIVFVIDSVACRGAHSTEARFHVGDAQVAIEGNVGRVRYGKAGMTVYALGDVALEAFSAAVESDAARKDAGPAPTARPEFARLKEQPATLAGRAEFTDSVTLPWALVFESSYAPRALPFEAGKGTAVEIRLPGSSDERLLFVALAEWGLARLEGLAFVGRWGLFRFAGGELSRAWGADAWVIEHKGKRLFTRIGNTGGGIIYPTVYESARSIF